MTLYAVKKERVFNTREDEERSHLRRKRSDGRLKAYNSNTDRRAWGLDSDERRRHILELLNNYETTLGNYIPFDELIKLLAHLKDAEKSHILNDAFDTLEEVDKILSENDNLNKEKDALLDQQKELNALANCLSQAGGDLRKENQCLKDEIERLRRLLADLQKEKAELQAQNDDLKAEKEGLKPGQGVPGAEGGMEKTPSQIKQERFEARMDKDKPLDEEAEELERPRKSKEQEKEAPERGEGLEVQMTSMKLEGGEEEEEEEEEEEGEGDSRSKKPKSPEEEELEAKERDQKEWEEREKKPQEEREKKPQEEREKKPQEKRERKSQEERERKSQEKRERKSQEERERKSQEEREEKPQEEREKKPQEEREKKPQEEREKKPQEEREKKPQEEREKKELEDKMKEKNEKFSNMEKELNSCQEDLDNLTQERDCLRKEIARLKRAENELAQAERRIQELLCELEMLQCCLHKHDKEACELVQVIHNQQADIERGKVLECTLRDVCRERDQLKCLVEKQNANLLKLGEIEALETKNNCLKLEVNHLKTVECQKTEMEEERTRLLNQVQKLAQICQSHVHEKALLDKKITQQQECIETLQQALSCIDLDGNESNQKKTGCKKSSSNLSSPSKNQKELQNKMKELEGKVCQQATLIMSQRKCLLEQHKYILDQEHIRNNMQKRIREQSRKQAELVYESNVLRSEIKFLSNRLKSYLDKIQILEKSVEQFFDGQKGRYPPKSSTKCHSQHPPQPRPPPVLTHPQPAQMTAPGQIHPPQMKTPVQPKTVQMNTPMQPQTVQMKAPVKLQQAQMKSPRPQLQLESQYSQGSMPDYFHSPSQTTNASDNFPQYIPQQNYCQPSVQNTTSVSSNITSDSYRYDMASRPNLCSQETTMNYKDDYIPPRSSPSRSTNTPLDEYDIRKPPYSSTRDNFLYNIPERPEKIVSGQPKSINGVGLSGNRHVKTPPTKLQRSKFNSPAITEEMTSKESPKNSQGQPRKKHCPCS